MMNDVSNPMNITGEDEANKKDERTFNLSNSS